jgi:Mrp family chromosome partitioning ATPase
MDWNSDKNKTLKDTLAKIKKKYVVLSGKGGVGKSTVAVNLAVGLALQGCFVGLLDSDLHGPSIAKMLNLTGHVLSGTDENHIEPAVLWDGKLKVMSIQFMLPNVSDSVIWRGPLKHKIIQQFIGDVTWGPLDFLIVDSPPGTGDEPLSVIQTLENCDGAIIVTTPQDVSTFDVKKSINFCKTVDLPIFGIIENMAGFVCPKCGEVTHIFGRNGGSKMAEEMNLRFLGSIPIDPRFVESGDIGKAYIQETVDSPAFAAVNKIVGLF